MKLTLKDFQVDAVAELMDEVQSARLEAVRKPQAISLCAPTGSGKTVIMTEVIERILAGDDEHARDPDAVFLWLTDQPELNEQTRQKMVTTSSVLAGHQLVVVDAAINQPSLFPGRVYFLNTQKLGKNSLLVKKGDDRAYTLWNWIANTVNERPTSFYLIIDEAHRGMMEGKDREEATSIIQKFIKGAPGEVPAVPLVIGVSATPERFDQVIAGTTRTRRPVVVDTARVRESGLLKEAVDLFHPDEAQHSDMTMLRAAARAWREFDEKWSTYCTREGVAPVRPLLLVQVQDADGGGTKVSKTDIAEAIKALREEMGVPPLDWFAHAFQEGVAVDVGGTSLRYLAPSAIDADPACRVVFFKTSLTTGWDCPRAEVMMSFRAASDDTLIAQLVGRMVRSPLARRVDADEHLNSVALYLPHYDKAGLERVVKRLEAGDPTILPPTNTRMGREVVRVERRVGLDEVFDAYEEMPSYVIPRKRRGSQVRRLAKLGSLLARYELDTNAPDEVRAFLVGRLLQEAEARRGTEDFERVVKEGGLLEVRKVSWRHDPALTRETTVKIEVSPENVEDLFEWAGRKLGEGLHVEYWKSRAGEGASRHMLTKLEVYALASMPEVIASLEASAKAEVQRLLDHHREAVKVLAEEGRQAFREIRMLSSEPETAPVSAPIALDVSKCEDRWEDHVYVDAEAAFPCKLNRWERAVLTEELAREDTIGWLRNFDRKPWAICIPYRVAGDWKGLYPDFVVFRRSSSGRVLVDIIDPHLTELEDAPAKAVALATYAERHHEDLGRVELIIVEQAGKPNERVRRLDLMDDATRRRVMAVQDGATLRLLFEVEG